MGISIWQLLIILLIVVLLFGSKRLRSLGGDLGSALRGFRKEFNDQDDTADQQDNLAAKDQQNSSESKEKDADFEKRD